MSGVTAQLVKELREKTSAGMMDCKKALQETEGDFELAVEWLRKKGLASAAKKSGRIAAEGAVLAKIINNTGVIVEVNSETDFVARNEAFQGMISEIAQTVAGNAGKVNSVEDLAKTNWGSTSVTVEETLREKIAKIGENIVIRRFQTYQPKDSLIAAYVHGEGKIGVLVEVTTTQSSNADVKTLAQDLCLHIAAMNPMAIRSTEISADVIAKEKEILKGKNLEQGKKPEMIDKIVEGQIKKFLAESCLLDQAFVKNPDLKVSQYVADTAKKVGSPVDVKRFARFELGEGIEKKHVDFAAEVAEQMKAH